MFEFQKNVHCLPAFPQKRLKSRPLESAYTFFVVDKAYKRLVIPFQHYLPKVGKPVYD
jgi:hypothetical protein